ncbi:hypothetical protein LCGC14_2581180, partial [marine sediment metagenome]
MTDEKKELVEIKDKPKEVVEFAHQAAKLLKEIIDSQPKIIINGKQYIDFQGWQTIARFYKSSVGNEWTKPIHDKDGKVTGYEARAIVKDKEYRTISAAESSCSRDETTWKGRPDFQLRSMAQTRACVKALRNVFAWVVVLAGYSPTPMEEMTDCAGSGIAKPSKEGKATTFDPNKSYECEDCGQPIKSPKVAEYSIDKFGKPVCP